MLVTLVQLPQLTSPTNYVSTIAIPPLGLAYLAASARRAGHEVKVADAVGSGLESVWPLPDNSAIWMRGLPFDEILERIDPASRAIGVGCMFSSQWPPARTFLERLRRRFPEATLILGGEHASAMPERIMGEAPLDACVVGEGEETFVDLLGHLGNGGGLGDVAGVVWRNGRGIQVNPRRPRIRDVDAIPPPAWDLFPVEDYLAFASPHGSVRGRSLPMLATRGCPYRCTFCSSAQMWTRAWRPRDPRAVVDEMVRNHETYGATDFHFEDLTAVVRRGWVLTFCRELLARKLSFTWQLPSGTRSEAIDGEVAALMVRSGCRNFGYSIESGSRDTLRRIRKKIRLRRVHASARAAMKAGIRLQVTFVLGFPHETWRHALATYREIARCAVRGFHEFHCCAFAPLPNSESYEELRRAGRLVPDDDYFYDLFCYMDVAHYRSWHPRWGDRRLRLMIHGAFALFYGLAYLCRPWRLVVEAYQYATHSSPGKLGKLVRGVLHNRRLHGRVRDSASL